MIEADFLIIYFVFSNACHTPSLQIHNLKYYFTDIYISSFSKRFDIFVVKYFPYSTPVL